MVCLFFVFMVLQFVVIQFVVIRFVVLQRQVLCGLVVGVIVLVVMVILNREWSEPDDWVNHGKFVKYDDGLVIVVGMIK